MKTAQEIVEIISQRLGYMYHHRPLMYGGTPEGVETLVWHFHHLYAEIVERREDFFEALGQVAEEEDCNSKGFAGRYRSLYPQASDEETAQYVAEQWRKISDRLGVPIAHEEIIEELRKDFGS